MEELLTKAKVAMEFSYAPYSGYHVGAAVRTADGRIYTGCNVENASYGATICAERTAILKSVSEGCRNLTEIAICCDGDGYPYPCGLCLQVMTEFMPEGKVYVTNGVDTKEFTVKELLPQAFSL